MGCYILEKFFIEDYNKKIVPSSYSPVIVRPCKLSYDKLLKHFHGQGKQKMVCFEGAIAFYEPDEWDSYYEWLIDLNVSKCIVPDFERHICNMQDKSSFGKERVMLEKDLHTNEVLYENPNFKNWIKISKNACA